jgi:3,4-dihydroxy 2-butanone 4-phosphate synthase/GTP cyclohydrolase II
MQLALYLSSHNLTRAEFAERIGVTPGAITGYCNGSLWPKRPVMERIIKATRGKVTPNDFMQAEASA